MLLLKAIILICIAVTTFRAAALVMIRPSAIRRVVSIAHNDIRMVPSMATSTTHIAQPAKLPAIRPLQRDIGYADRIVATPELKIRSLLAFALVTVNTLFDYYIDEGAGGYMRVVSTAIFANELVVFVEGDGTGGSAVSLGRAFIVGAWIATI